MVRAAWRWHSIEDDRRCTSKSVKAPMRTISTSFASEAWVSHMQTLCTIDFTPFTARFPTAAIASHCTASLDDAMSCIEVVMLVQQQSAA